MNQDDILKKFIADTLVDSGVPVLSVDIGNYGELLTLRKRFTLDFDDAYQSTLCHTNDLILVSFDKDFDRTDRGRATPGEVLEKL